MGANIETLWDVIEISEYVFLGSLGIWLVFYLLYIPISLLLEKYINTVWFTSSKNVGIAKRIYSIFLTLVLLCVMIVDMLMRAVIAISAVMMVIKLYYHLNI